MNKEFKRESRYIVIKKSDLEKVDKSKQGYVNSILLLLCNVPLPKRKCLVIESDWPEYEPTWAAIERRVTGAAQWDGEGVPPAGTVCELRMTAAGSDWARAEIKFASRNVIVWDWEGESPINGLCTGYIHTVQFRPIRTPEQIAADERRAAVAEMADIARMATGMICNLADFQALYDAGYRKQVAS